MPELTASISSVNTRYALGDEWDVCRDHLSSGAGAFLADNKVYVGHVDQGGSRGHSYYRSYLIFDTSGIDAAPLLKVTGTMATSIGLSSFDGAPEAGSELDPSLIILKASLTSSTAPPISFENYNDFDGWTSGSAHTGPIYGAAVTGSVIAALGANDYVQLTGTAVYQFHPVNIGAGRRPRIIYAAGTTSSKIMGVTPGKQKSIVGVSRDKSAKVQGSR